MNAVYDARQHHRVGRTIGVLLLSQMVFAPLANFGLLRSVFAPPGFLVNAAPRALQVSSAALILLAMGALSLGIAIAALPAAAAVAMPLFGHRIVFSLLLPLGLSHLILAGWLLTRGFEKREVKS